MMPSERKPTENIPGRCWTMTFASHTMRRRDRIKGSTGKLIFKKVKRLPAKVSQIHPPGLKRREARPSGF